MQGAKSRGGQRQANKQNKHISEETEEKGKYILYIVI
jgi:hypothetical protein